MLKKIKNKIKVFLKKAPTQFEKNEDKLLVINNIFVKINWNDGGGRAYKERESFEEVISPFYKFLKGIDLAIDVGANYGFIGSIIAQKALAKKLILVEPNPDLIPYIEENMKLNNIKNYEIINAICGEELKAVSIFNVLPNESQDSRVIGENSNWQPIYLKMISLDNIIQKENPRNFFIKIDTQGYEFPIFRGMEKVLSNRDNWIIKSEFAPYWLIKQGTNPIDFINYLIERYEVCEMPKRLLYSIDNLDYLFMRPLNSLNIDEFLNYIIHLNDNKLGWVDILVRPKSK